MGWKHLQLQLDSKFCGATASKTVQETNPLTESISTNNKVIVNTDNSVCLCVFTYC